MFVKKEITDSEDWSTNTDNPMVNGFRDIMKKLNEYVDKPDIGLFFYDITNNELFGVKSNGAFNTIYTYSNYLN